MVTVEELMTGPYIAHSRHLPVGALTAQAIEAAGGEFKPAVEVMQFSAACAMVEAGCGVAVLESLSAGYAAFHGLAVKRLDASSDLSLIAAWSPSKGLSAVSRKILTAIGDSVGIDA
jgi:DNA-binding transcriptional LysR family regulator